MDSLHSQRCLRREGYEDSSLRLATSDSRLQRLPVLQRLLVARALERGAVVYTARSRSPARGGVAGPRAAGGAGERSFPRRLEGLYRNVPPSFGSPCLPEEPTMYQGVIVPLITPLTAGGEVCAASVERLIESVRPAASGLIPALSSGEGWRLSPAQWRDMVTWTRRFARGLPVLAGIVLPTIAEVMERAWLARELEVEAVVVRPPSARICLGGELRAQYRTIARESGLPLFLYNEPKLAGTALGPRDARRAVPVGGRGGGQGLRRVGGADPRRWWRPRTGVPVFQGWEHLCLATTPGVQGYILPLSNLEAPALSVDVRGTQRGAPGRRCSRQCAAHDLLGDAWYAGIKRELRRRGVIADASPGAEAPCQAAHEPRTTWGWVTGTTVGLIRSTEVLTSASISSRKLEAA